MDGLLVDHAASEARIECRDSSLAIMYIGTMGRKDVHKPPLHWLVCPFLCFVAERNGSSPEPEVQCGPLSPCLIHIQRRGSCSPATTVMVMIQVIPNALSRGREPLGMPAVRAIPLLSKDAGNRHAHSLPGTRLRAMKVPMSVRSTFLIQVPSEFGTMSRRKATFKPMRSRVS